MLKNNDNNPPLIFPVFERKAHGLLNGKLRCEVLHHSKIEVDFFQPTDQHILGILLTRFPDSFLLHTIRFFFLHHHIMVIRFDTFVCTVFFYVASQQWVFVLDGVIYHQVSYFVFYPIYF
jgi:hypothetical protein